MRIRSHYAYPPRDINKWTAALLIFKNSNQNCVSKSNSILHCFLITFSDHKKKPLLPDQLCWLTVIFFQYVFIHPSWIFLWLKSQAYFLSYKIDCHWQFYEENWLKESVPLFRILIHFYGFKVFLIPCRDSSIVFNWKHFEMRLLNLRINFFYLLRTFCPHLGSFCVVSSLRFRQISPLAFFRWLTATSDKNTESCNRIPSNYCLP